MKLFRLSTDSEDVTYTEPDLAGWTWLENPDLPGIHRFDRLETLCRWAMNARTGETHQIGRMVVTCVDADHQSQ